MKISFSGVKLDKIETLALGVLDGGALTPQGKAIDKQLKSLISRTIEGFQFKGKAGSVHLLHTPAGAPFAQIALFGLGKAKELDEKTARKAGGALGKHLDTAGLKAASVVVESPKGALLDDAQLAAELAFGAVLKSYRFQKYHTKLTPDQKPALAKLAFLTDSHKTAKQAFDVHASVAEGVFLTRDVVSEPANVIYPESFAEKFKALTALGATVEVLGEKEMKKLGMGSLLGVGQGSVRESQLVVVRWNGGAKKDEAPVAIVGKGVTFDTGGISIKPAGGMEDMKWDMGGAGVVLGLMHALAARKAKVNVVGVAGLVENMPDGNAQRPGDVVTSMSGQTIEVINTDAEGRLVLADALWYTKERFKPKAMINLATLTGAIIVALGKSRGGLFSNNDKLAGQLFKVGEKEGERLWRLPVGEEYDSHIKSDIADMKNVGKPGQAGSISAAQFLLQFVGDTPWAHLDIAGVAWAYEEIDTARKGASGFGVRLLNRFIAEQYEK
ncbi:MAG: leucyl aminopeptidase [Alphaproteobacteria bacterium]|nr:leucyl aminopeptidase [Alphaproteobacteria bacterium]